MDFLPILEPTAWDVTIWTGRFLGVLVVPAVLLQRSTRPLATVVWILTLIFVPFLGIILWWLLGRDFMKRRRRRRSRARREIGQRFENLRKEHRGADPQHRPRITLDLQETRGILRDFEEIFPPTKGNLVTHYEDAFDAFSAFSAAIDAAEHHIHFQFYIWKPDETGRRFRDLLARKAAEGIEVRVLYDALGGMNLTPRFLAPIREAGGLVGAFMPPYLWEQKLRVNFRNHRKILVIDGHVGFTGGVNIADEYLSWFDTATGVSGPVVLQLQEVFAEDWYFTTGEDLADAAHFPLVEEPRELPGEPVTRNAGAIMVASGPDERLDILHKTFFLALTNARQRIHLITPYFVPDQATLTALQTAALRGVDVQIITPGATDIPMALHAGRTFWESLLEVGVQISQFNEKILHAKLLIVDDRLSMVGSANVDVRSFRLNFEANLLIDDEALNQRLEETFQAALERSDAVDLATFRARPRRERMREGVARLFSPLL